MVLDANAGVVGGDKAKRYMEEVVKRKGRPALIRRKIEKGEPIDAAALEGEPRASSPAEIALFRARLAACETGRGRR